MVPEKIAELVGLSRNRGSEIIGNTNFSEIDTLLSQHAFRNSERPCPLPTAFCLLPTAHSHKPYGLCVSPISLDHPQSQNYL